MKKEIAENLIKKTKDDYNLIAQDFSRTRGGLWDEILFLFDNYLRERDRVLDAGCGNGRYVPVFKKKGVEYFGIDQSQELIEIARKTYPESKFFVGGILNLPFQNNYFDNICSIAVLHQIPSKELRLQFLKELKRTLKPGGNLIITVWMPRQKKELLACFKYTILKLLGKTDLDFGDAMISFGKQAERYYHFFSKTELRDLIERAGFKIKELGAVKNEKGNRQNIYLVAVEKSST